MLYTGLKGRSILSRRAVFDNVASGLLFSNPGILRAHPSAR